MRFQTRFAWPLAASVALVSVPALAQDGSSDAMESTSSYDRDSHFNGIYVQGFGGFGVNGANGNTFEFDTDRNGSYNEQVTTVGGANAFSPGFCNGAKGPSRTAGCAPDKAGAEYGARIGFDARS
ncbi:MAG: hypothetical protein B7Y74_14200, partial [Novosphingobium sp. 35-62-5]